jgi:hypothetical protein
MNLDLLPIDAIALKYGTDKSSLHHNYTPLYEQYFAHLKDQDINLLELGWGGHEDPNKGGESAAMWREYFSKANIQVIDIVNKVNNVKGVEFHQGSQADSKFLHSISNNRLYDIVVDDASHLSSLTIKSFQILFPLVRPGGWYVVEDTHSSYHAFYYGRKEANPDPERNGFSTLTTMNYFKRLCDEINKDLIDPRYHLGFEIETMHFYKDIIFIQKK